MTSRRSGPTTIRLSRVRNEQDSGLTGAVAKKEWAAHKKSLQRLFQDAARLSDARHAAQDALTTRILARLNTLAERIGRLEARMGMDESE